MFYHPQVLAGKNRCVIFALKYRKVFSGPAGFFQNKAAALGDSLGVGFRQGGVCVNVKVPPACVGTEAALRAAVGQIGAHKAAAGVGDAHRSVDKDLQLHVGNGVLDLSDFGQASLAAKNNAAKAHRLVDFYGLAVYARRLGAKVQRRVWKMLLQYRNDSQILNDKGVYRILFEVIHAVQKGVDVLVVEYYVQGAMQFFLRKTFF